MFVGSWRVFAPKPIHEPIQESLQKILAGLRACRMGQGPEAVLGVRVHGDVELRCTVGGAQFPSVDPGLGSNGGRCGLRGGLRR